MVTLRIRKNASSAYLSLDINDGMSIEATYRAMDAESLDTQCANMTTTITVPRTANNISILTALYDIRTIYTTATFDIYGKCEAVLGINGEETFGYVSLVSAGKTFELSFRSGLSIVMEALEGKSIGELFTGVAIPFTIASFDNYYDYWSNGGTRNTSANWDASKKRWTSNLENFCFIVAPSDNDATVKDLFIKADSKKKLNLKWGRYNENGSGYDPVAADLPPLHFNSAKTSALRLCVKASYVAQLILESLGYTIDYDADFFNYKNKYSANIFMALAKVQNAETSDVATYMPDVLQKDYLISFLKLFGLYIIFDGGKVSVKLRKNYYDTATIRAIDNVVDKSTITIRPNEYYKSYKGSLESGLDAIDYASAQGTKVQGGVIVNGAVTEDAENILDGSIFRTAPMLRYEGQLSGLRWSNSEANCYISFEGSFDSALFGDSGCELVIPQYAMAGAAGMYFTLFEEDIQNTKEEWYFYDGGNWKQYVQTPFAVPISNDVSTYPYNRKLFVNYTSPVTIAASEKDGFFNSVHQSYINTISDRDAVLVDCEAHLTPSDIYLMKKCNLLVKIDNTLCRIVEFVVNASGKARMTLQKILNPSGLTSGQDDFAPYFRTPNPLFFANNATGQKNTEINSNMDSITGTITGSGGVGAVGNNGKRLSLSSVTLPIFPGYQGDAPLPQSLQSRITYHAPDLQLTTIQDVFRIPPTGLADIFEGEYMGILHVVVGSNPVIVKSRYFNMPEGWTYRVFHQDGTTDTQYPFWINVLENGDLKISRGLSPSPVTLVVGFFDENVDEEFFATCEIAINQ